MIYPVIFQAKRRNFAARLFRRPIRHLLAYPVLLATAVIGSTSHGASTPAPENPGTSAVGKPSAVAKWWDGKRATGDLLGARKVIEDHGLTLDGKWRGIFFGIADSQRGPGNAFTQELAFSAKLDFAKLTKLQTLDGLSAFGEVRWREPGYDANPNNIVLASPLFNPSRYAGGVGWRLMNFGLTYKSPELFGVKDFLTATAGWLQPQKEFLEQPLARLFVNNAMASTEGVGANIPFS